jgi:putative DNA primase/helicase
MLERRAREEHEAARTDFEAQNLVAEAEKKHAQDEIKNALKQGGDPKGHALRAVQAIENPPARRRYLINDTTVEKLGEILNANPRGVLIFRDELTDFLKTMDREGHEADRAFYLEAWNGAGRFTYDRIGRGTIEIEAACVSILGGIQPGPLAAYMARVAQGGGDDDGLVQRFQLVVWPDTEGTWKDVDTHPDTAAQQRAYTVFEQLDRIDPVAVGAGPAGTEGEPPFLRFAPEAHELFLDWRTELEHRLRSGEEPALLESHLAKYRSLVPSLALLIHLADVGAGPIGEHALHQACAWSEYLESHARRVYVPALSPVGAAARALADRIMQGDLGRLSCCLMH